MCSMQNSETEPVKYRELLHMEAHFRMCDYLTRNGVVYNAGIWRPHRKCGLGYVEMAPLEYYVRLMKGVEDITRSNGKFAGKNTGKLRREK